MGTYQRRGASRSPQPGDSASTRWPHRANSQRTRSRRAQKQLLACTCVRGRGLRTTGAKSDPCIPPRSRGTAGRTLRPCAWRGACSWCRRSRPGGRSRRGWAARAPRNTRGRSRTARGPRCRHAAALCRGRSPAAHGHRARAQCTVGEHGPRTDNIHGGAALRGRGSKLARPHVSPRNAPDTCNSTSRLPRVLDW